MIFWVLTQGCLAFSQDLHIAQHKLLGNKLLLFCTLARWNVALLKQSSSFMHHREATLFFHLSTSLYVQTCYQNAWLRVEGHCQIALQEYHTIRQSPTTLLQIASRASFDSVKIAQSTVVASRPLIKPSLDCIQVTCDAADGF